MKTTMRRYVLTLNLNVYISIIVRANYASS